MQQLTLDALFDAQADGDYALRQAKLADEDLPSMVKLSMRIVGTRPRTWKDLEQRAKLSRLYDEWIIYHQRRLPPPLLRFVIAHEIGEFIYKGRGYERWELEARCNALAAAACAPRDAVRRAVKRIGQEVDELASQLAVPQSVAVLRLGEVLDRPVVLLRGDLPIVRGGPFVWPANDLHALVKKPPPEVRPVKIADSPGRWALMARSVA
jgi:hypothetical protein